MKLSCVTASYVADLLGYPGEIDWGLAMEAIVRRPMLEIIDGILDRLSPARLDGIEFWYPHVWPANITPAVASEVHKRLAARGMKCCACAGSIPEPRKDPYGCKELFQTARLLEAPLIAGHIDARAIPQLSQLCALYGIRVAYENGSEKDAAQILSVIQGGNEWIGVNIDTGNMAAQGGDPVQAIRELGERIMHVHFKDVPDVGSHECVALGEGIVDVPGVIRELQALGFNGWLSIEIETGDHDPTDEILASAERIRRLWNR
jgi:L-ribulose-5-phosphate 3-epimerase